MQKFAHFGMRPYRVLAGDAIFVSEDLARNLERHRPGLQLPVDEFDCYRRAKVAEFHGFMGGGELNLTQADLRRLFFTDDVYQAHAELRGRTQNLGAGNWDLR